MGPLDGGRVIPMPARKSGESRQTIACLGDYLQSKLVETSGVQFENWNVSSVLGFRIEFSFAIHRRRL